LFGFTVNSITIDLSHIKCDFNEKVHVLGFVLSGKIDLISKV